MRAVFAVLLLCVASTYAVDVSAIINNLHSHVIGAVNLGIQTMLQHFLNLLGGQARLPFFNQVVSNVQNFANAQIQLVQQSITNAQNLFNGMIDAVTGNKPQRIMDHINEALNHSQQLLATVANQLIAGILAGLNGNPRIFSTIGSIFTGVVDTVTGHIVNIGTAVGQVVTGVIETAQPHVDNLITELQGHAENAIQSVSNAIAGINQGLGY